MSAQKELAVILASHGQFAVEALKAAEMIVGQQENCATLSVTDDKNLATCMEELSGTCAKLNTAAGLLVLVDMYGGTPCNAASALVLTVQGEMEIELLSGFNLPMLLELFSNRQMAAAEMKSYLQEVYPLCFKDVKEVLNAESEDDDADQLG